MEVLTNHESSVRNGVVLALKKVNQEKQHVNDKSERDDMTLWNPLILDIWWTQIVTISVRSYLKRHPTIGNEAYDTRIHKFPYGPSPKARVQDCLQKFILRVVAQLVA